MWFIHVRFIQMHNNNDNLISSLLLCSSYSWLSLEKINHQTVDRAMMGTMDTFINNKSTYWIYK